MSEPDATNYRIRASGNWGQLLYPEVFATIDKARTFISDDSRTIVTRRYSIWAEAEVGKPWLETWEVETIDGGAASDPEPPGETLFGLPIHRTGEKQTGGAAQDP